MKTKSDSAKCEGHTMQASLVLHTWKGYILSNNTCTCKRYICVFVGGINKRRLQQIYMTKRTAILTPIKLHLAPLTCTLKIQTRSNAHMVRRCLANDTRTIVQSWNMLAFTPVRKINKECTTLKPGPFNGIWGRDFDGLNNGKSNKLYRHFTIRLF